MAKNPTIAEGGISRGFGNIAKIRTHVQGGRDCDWIPKEDASQHVVTEPLSVTQNGTYTPSRPANGFSSVTVNVPSPSYNLGSVNNIYDADDSITASSYGYDGISSITLGFSLGGTYVTSVSGKFNNTTRSITVYKDTNDGTFTISGIYWG